MFKAILHQLHGPHPSVLILKTYRPHTKTRDGDLFEVTEVLLQCSHCGRLWVETLMGKEIEIAKTE